jgi:hypothetical protein
VVAQVGRHDRAAMAGEIFGRTGDDQPEGRGQPDPDHVRLEIVAHSDAGVEAALDQVDQLVLAANLDLDVGIGGGEALDHRFDQEGDGGAGDIEAKKARRSFAEASRRLERGGEAGEGGQSVLQEALARFGQADAAGGTGEQGHSDPRLERPDRLADRRRREAEIVGRGTEAAPVGNAQERFHSVELVAGDYVFLLHDLSTL